MIEQFGSFIRLTPSTNIKPFECTNKDLNEFLLHDAINHCNELLAVTYYLENQDETIGYFSVLNDSIRQEDIPSRSRREKMFHSIPHPKRGYKSHPAVKVGRLAVHTKYQSHGIGAEIMDYIKGYFLDNNKTGCRFITVDADNNPKTINFYKRNGFEFLTTSDIKEKNRLMFFDLIRFAPYVQNLPDSI